GSTAADPNSSNKVQKTGTGGTDGTGGAGSDSGGPTGPCGVGKPTGFDGDDSCLEPPADGEGLQIHIGPSSYDDPDVINATDPTTGNPLWLLNPGEEPTQCYRTYTPNTEGIYYFRQQYRMRPGSHHMIIMSASDSTAPEGWEAQCGNIVNSIGGTQHVAEEFPPGDKEAPEDKGIARGLDPHAPLDIQLHFYNTTDTVKLREVWVNLLYKPKSEVTTVLGYLGGFAPVNIPPHTTTQIGGVCDIKNAVLSSGTTERIVTLFGHAHSHNTRFAVYWDKADGSTETVYDNYDWAEASTFTYNSVIQNPTPDPAAKKAGAYSGQLILNPGEKLRYQCDIQNDSDLTLHAVEKVFDGEMCNLFGTVAGPGFPCFDLSKVTTPPKAPPTP
ncbi:MAG TPA: hypothetical protein VF395_22435, partial [Polyangiaceae bacterium]